MKKRFSLAGLTLMLVLAQQVTSLSSAQAYQRVYYSTPVHRHYHRASVFQRHPVASRAVTGVALGAIGGAAVGAITGHHRIGRGALIGAGTGGALGAGLGLFRNKQSTGRWF